jgi:alkyl hydroperoxide reductase subunit D
MTTLQELKDRIPDYARDARVNLGNVLTEEHAQGLTLQEIAGTALSAAYHVGQKDLIEALEAEYAQVLDDAERLAIKGAVSVMAMNNVYYRTMHLAEDAALDKLPAGLRMQIIGKPGIEKKRFEIYSLAISALAGCGRCVTAHIMELRKTGLSDVGIQSIIRIAAVVNAAAAALKLESL